MRSIVTHFFAPVAVIVNQSDIRVKPKFSAAVVPVYVHMTRFSAIVRIEIVRIEIVRVEVDAVWADLQGCGQNQIFPFLFVIPALIVLAQPLACQRADEGCGTERGRRKNARDKRENPAVSGMGYESAACWYWKVS